MRGEDKTESGYFHVINLNFAFEIDIFSKILMVSPFCGWYDFI